MATATNTSITDTCNVCPPSRWLDRPDPNRGDYIRTECGVCGKFLGYRLRTQQPTSRPRK